MCKQVCVPMWSFDQDSNSGSSLEWKKEKSENSQAEFRIMELVERERHIFLKHVSQRLGLLLSLAAGCSPGTAGGSPFSDPPKLRAS